MSRPPRRTRSATRPSTRLAGSTAAARTTRVAVSVFDGDHASPLVLEHRLDGSTTERPTRRSVTGTVLARDAERQLGRDTCASSCPSLYTPPPHRSPTMCARGSKHPTWTGRFRTSPIRRLVARLHAVLGERYGAPGKGPSAAVVAACTTRVTARALSAARGILHRRLEDAVAVGGTRIIGVTFPDTPLLTARPSQRRSFHPRSRQPFRV